MDTTTSNCDDVMGAQAANSDHTFLDGQNMEDWMPTIEELEKFDSEESYESDYFTDDELGTGGGVSKPKPKRKRTLRPLSSDDLDSGDDKKRKRGQGSRRGKRYCREQQRNHLDDGDEQLYKMRIRCPD